MQLLIQRSCWKRNRHNNQTAPPRPPLPPSLPHTQPFVEIPIHDEQAPQPQTTLDFEGTLYRGPGYTLRKMPERNRRPVSGVSFYSCMEKVQDE